jgi:hypothetical protein
VDNSGGIELLGGTKDGCLFCYSGGNYILPSPTVEIVIEPVNPPIIIPPQGGTLQYQALVVNAWFTSTFFDYWTMLTLPDSSEYGPLFLRFNINLLPGGSIIRTFSQTVPGSAPFGDYVFTAYVGDYQSYSIWDEDAFSFSKSGVDDSGIENWIASGWEEEEDAINESSALETYFLYPPTPNPFNNITEITYFLPEAGEISLVVYNALGQEVATLDSGWKSAGFYTVIFNGDNLASGLYLCSMKDKNSSQVRKILLLK